MRNLDLFITSIDKINYKPNYKKLVHARQKILRILKELKKLKERVATTTRIEVINEGNRC